MYNTREKLIELFRAIAHENCFGSIENIADYLIDNGVTITETGLTERLKKALENSQAVIISDVKSDDYFKGFYDAVTIIWKIK